VRLILFIAVIALAVDAYYYSGAYTQALVKQAIVIAEDVQNRVRDGAKETAPDSAAPKPAEPTPPRNNENL
jgi:hypothetical protein